MPTRFWIGVTVVLTLVVALGTVIVHAIARKQGIAIDGTTRALIGAELAAVGSVAAILGVIDRWLWRMWPLRAIGWPGKAPILRGTWQMDLTVVKATPDQKTKGKTGYLVIDQTASQVEATVFFVNGSHQSVQTMLAKEKATWKLYYFYVFQLTGGSYTGATILTVEGGKLKGEYWNTVGGQGTWKSSGHVPELHDSRDSAARAFSRLSRTAACTTQ